MIEKRSIKQPAESNTKVIFFQVLQHMSALQDEVDRAREKRLLREKGRYQDIFLLSLKIVSICIHSARYQTSPKILKEKEKFQYINVYFSSPLNQSWRGRGR